VGPAALAKRGSHHEVDDIGSVWLGGDGWFLGLGPVAPTEAPTPVPFRLFAHALVPAPVHHHLERRLEAGLLGLCLTMPDTCLALCAPANMPTHAGQWHIFAEPNVLRAAVCLVSTCFSKSMSNGLGHGDYTRRLLGLKPAATRKTPYGEHRRMIPNWRQLGVLTAIVLVIVLVGLWIL